MLEDSFLQINFVNGSFMKFNPMKPLFGSILCNLPYLNKTKANVTNPISLILKKSHISQMELRL